MDDENEEATMKMFVNLPAEVITQGVSKIHEEFAKYFKESIQKKTVHLLCYMVFKDFFLIIQNRCVQATEDLSRLVSKTAKQRPATLEDL